MSAHVLLNLLNELGGKDKMRGFPQRVWFRQYLFEFNTGIYYIDIQTMHIEDLNESLRLI